jgi:hypothetical protein
VRIEGKIRELKFSTVSVMYALYSRTRTMHQGFKSSSPHHSVMILVAATVALEVLLLVIGMTPAA